MKTTFTKVAVATVIAGTTLFGGAASAATKDETKVTDRYRIKSGDDNRASSKSHLWERL